MTARLRDVTSTAGLLQTSGHEEHRQLPFGRVGDRSRVRDPRQPGDRGAARRGWRRRPPIWSPALAFARERGGPALRALTFAERGELLRALSRAIHAAPRRAHRARDRERRQHPRRRQVRHRRRVGHARRTTPTSATSSATRTLLVDGDGVQLGRIAALRRPARAASPRAGVAVHVNAFNFPAWGLAEKAACALLAGMPVDRQAGDGDRAGRAPDRRARRRGQAPARRARSRSSPARRAICSITSAARTCSRSPARRDTARAAARRTRGSSRTTVRVNVEADSLNAAVLGPDVERGLETVRPLRRRRRRAT